MTARDVEYFEYLKKRSILGKIYRNWILYPRISKCLEGVCIDVGCGIGDFLRFSKNVVGLDVNHRTVDYCKQLGFDARVMDFNKIPFEDNSVDSVLLDNVIEHIENPADLLADIHRVLKPGGKLLVGVPGIKGYASDDDHKVFYDEKKLVDKMVLCGFNMFEIFHMPLKFPLMSDKLSSYCIYGLFCVDKK